MAQLLICRGLPGAGKTYWAKRVLQEYALSGDRGKIVRSNRDAYRRMLFDSEYVPGSDQDIEDIVTKAQHAAIVVLLRGGIDVINDDTNLHPDHVMRLVGVAINADADWRVVDFNARLVQCVARDSRRNQHEKVGAVTIHRMHEKYLVPHGGLLPSLGMACNVKQLTGTDDTPWMPRNVEG